MVVFVKIPAFVRMDLIACEADRYRGVDGEGRDIAPLKHCSQLFNIGCAVDQAEDSDSKVRVIS